MELIPVKISSLANESIDMQIRRFVKEVEGLIERKPSYEDTYFKLNQGQEAVVALKLREEEVKELRDRSAERTFEIIDRPWNEVYKAYSEIGNNSAQIQTGLA